MYFPDLKGERDQVLVPSDGGSEPVWGPDGKELYHQGTKQDNRFLVAAQTATAPTLAVNARKRLFPIGDIGSTAPHTNYDISPNEVQPNEVVYADSDLAQCRTLLLLRGGSEYGPLSARAEADGLKPVATHQTAMLWVHEAR